MTKTKLPVKFFEQEDGRTLLDLLIGLTPGQLARFEEDALMVLSRAHAAHDSADREVKEIWRRVVKGAAS